MKYMGSKSRIAKHILPIILDGRSPGQYYVEPFVGGCNSIDKVSGNRIAGDINKYLIAMWSGLQRNRQRPHTISKELYDRARNVYRGKAVDDKLDDFMIGWIGWMASFNGRFFDGGYSGCACGRDYVNEQIKNTEAQIDRIIGVNFFSCPYWNLPLPKNSIIYCDPPYKGTKQYDVSKSFDYDMLWNWFRKMGNAGHKVFVSEYSAPEDFTCVWSMEVTNYMNQTKTYKPVEKLYTL